MQQSGDKECDLCPLLLPFPPLGCHYRGYVSLDDDTDYAISITLPVTGEIKNARLECDWVLAQLLKGKEAHVQKMLQESGDLKSFLMKFKQLMAECVRDGEDVVDLAHPPPRRPPTHYSRLVTDLDTIGWQRVTDVSSDFTKLTIKTLDSKKREHVIWVKMPQAEEDNPVITCDLPLPFKPIWTGKTGLREIVERFEEQLKIHQVFWDVMDQLDQETWILEPQNPTRGSNSRRIVICSNVSLYVTVDPRRPLALPEFKFLGPEQVVGQIRSRILARVSEWDSSGGVSMKKNLEILMDLKLPTSEESEQEGFCGECGVCYSCELEGLRPDIVCSNTHCNKPFHFTCLLEWLQTLPSTRKSFGVLFGECPYCNGQISCKLRR